MKSLHVILLLVIPASVAGCTSVDLARYRLPRSQPVPQHEQAESEDERQAVNAPHLALPELAQPVPSAPPATVPRVGVPNVPTPPSVPSPPSPVTACDPNGCWSAGERYQGGAGDTYLDRNGRLCRGSGGWMQCY